MSMSMSMYMYKYMCRSMSMQCYIYIHKYTHVRAYIYIHMHTYIFAHMHDAMFHIMICEHCWIPCPLSAFVHLVSIARGLVVSTYDYMTYYCVVCPSIRKTARVFLSLSFCVYAWSALVHLVLLLKTYDCHGFRSLQTFCYTHVSARGRERVCVCQQTTNNTHISV